MIFICFYCSEGEINFIKICVTFVETLLAEHGLVGEVVWLPASPQPHPPLLRAQEGGQSNPDGGGRHNHGQQGPE